MSRGRNLAWALVGVLAAALVIVLLAGAVTSRDNNSTLDFIEDCTTPGGECYDRGQEQTAAAVAAIGQERLLALACAFTVYRDDMSTEVLLERMTTCVAELKAATQP